MGKSPAFRLLGIGGSLAFWIIGGTLGGRWIDTQLDSDPVLTLLGLFLGIAVGVTDAIRRLKDVVKLQERRSSKRKK